MMKAIWDRFVATARELDGVHVDEVRTNAAHMTCATLAAKVDLMNLLAMFAAEDPTIVELAFALRKGARSDEAFAARLLFWVQAFCAWTEEPGERFAAPTWTLEHRRGDCDDSAMLFVSLALAAGLDADVVALADLVGTRPEGWHGVARVRVGGDWRWAETSTQADLGRDPREIRERQRAQARMGEAADGWTGRG